MRPNRSLAVALFSATALSACAQSAPPPANTSHSPVSFNVYERARADVCQWFAAPPESETYSYGESLLRISVSQRIHRVDWLGELTVPAIFDAPKDAVSPVTAQGQLGLGGTYYAANGNNSNPVMASFKQGYLRYHFDNADKTTLRLGRMEFFDGTEIKAKNPSMIWLQNNRVQQRIVGNFGFANAQRRPRRPSWLWLMGHYGVRRTRHPGRFQHERKPRAQRRYAIPGLQPADMEGPNAMARLCRWLS